MKTVKSRSYLSLMKDKQLNRKQKASITQEKLMRFLFGFNEKKGFLSKFAIYSLLITIGFVYLYPMLHIFITSIKSLSDLLDTSINWIPSTFFTENYKNAYAAMNLKVALKGSLSISLLPTIFQVLVAALVGYGFARYDFPLKKLLFVLMILTFIIPPQILMMPKYRLFSDLALTGSLKAFVIPALLGQGLNSSIFILLFYQFFRQTPISLYEAAEVDGASQLAIFFRIAIPMAAPAFIISFLFSFVWYWNETYLTTLYLTSKSNDITTVLLQMQQFDQNYEAIHQGLESNQNKINEGIKMAGTMISMLPLLIVYFFLQRYFVESIDRSGITGE